MNCANGVAGCEGGWIRTGHKYKLCGCVNVFKIKKPKAMSTKMFDELAQEYADQHGDMPTCLHHHYEGTGGACIKCGHVIEIEARELKDEEDDETVTIKLSREAAEHFAIGSNHHPRTIPGNELMDACTESIQQIHRKDLCLPWEAVKTDLGYYRIENGCGGISAGGGHPFAQKQVAELMAAAPELLAALQTIIEANEDDISVENLGPAVNALRKAGRPIK